MNGFDNFWGNSNIPGLDILDKSGNLKMSVDEYLKGIKAQKSAKDFQEFQDKYEKSERVRNFLLQEINDTLGGRILPENIHRDAIRTRHIKAGQVTADKILFAETNGLGSLALEDSLAYGDITGAKPPINADVTLSAIQGELSLAGGGLVLASAGAKIRGGQTAYGVGTGFWLGDVEGVSKFSIGSSAKYMKWDGAALTIKGMTSLDSLSALNANLGTITAGNITLNSSGFIRTAGKTSYADTTAGFWLGYDGGYKLYIGNATNWLKWSGSALLIKGRLSVGGGTNEDIYFEDSQIRMYDGVDGNIKQIKMRYSALDFIKIWHNPVVGYVSMTLDLGSPGNRLSFAAYADHSYINSESEKLQIYCDDYLQIICQAGLYTKYLHFYGTGQLRLPVLASNPTSNLADGQLCVVGGILKFYQAGAWRTVTVT